MNKNRASKLYARVLIKRFRIAAISGTISKPLADGRPRIYRLTSRVMRRTPWGILNRLAYNRQWRFYRDDGGRRVIGGELEKERKEGDGDRYDGIEKVAF